MRRWSKLLALGVAVTAFGGVVLVGLDTRGSPPERFTTAGRHCNGRGLPDLSFREADVVIEGTVRSQLSTTPGSWSVDVVAAYKGVAGPSETVMNKSGTFDCEVDFQTGIRYFIYADRTTDGTPLKTSLGDGTIEVKTAESFYLSDGSPVSYPLFRREPIATFDHADPIPEVAILIGAVGVLTASAMILALRVRRRRARVESV